MQLLAIIDSFQDGNLIDRILRILRLHVNALFILQHKYIFSLYEEFQVYLITSTVFKQN